MTGPQPVFRQMPLPERVAILEDRYVRTAADLDQLKEDTQMLFAFLRKHMEEEEKDRRKQIEETALLRADISNMRWAFIGASVAISSIWSVAAVFIMIYIK